MNTADSEDLKKVSDLSRVMKDSIYSHYNRGTLYKIINISLHVETREVLVNYASLTEPDIVFSRPVDIFNGMSGNGKKRFIPVSLGNSNCCGA